MLWCQEPHESKESAIKIGFAAHLGLWCLLEVRTITRSITLRIGKRTFNKGSVRSSKFMLHVFSV